MEYREEEDNNIAIFGAREHNLKKIDLTIPRDKLTVITGMSGSGKSSLAYMLRGSVGIWKLFPHTPVVFWEAWNVRMWIRLPG